MSLYKNVVYPLLISLLIGLWLLATIKTAAKEPEITPQTAQAAELVEIPAPEPTEPIGPILPPKGGQINGGGVVKTAGESGKHPIKAAGPITGLQLQTYLEDLKSPLAPYADSIAASDYWSMVIAICYHEQRHCTSAPYWNYWGLKGKGDCGRTTGGFAKFCTAESGITEIKKRVENYISRWGNNVEDWRGRYCVSSGGGVCWNWEYTIIAQKKILDALVVTETETQNQ